MCADRVLAGLEPACVKACPTDALVFGEREELVKEAHHRIANNPRTYMHHVFGETEVGGTCVLHLSSVPFEELGYRSDLPKKSLRRWTEPAMKPIPYIVTGLSVALGALAWITNRRIERQANSDPSTTNKEEVRS
jgi:formate dehydrogenase iron-sulfur subunit